MIDRPVLDDDAEKLYQELDGIHTDYVDEVLRDAERRLDAWRQLLVDAVGHISGFFAAVRFKDGMNEQGLPTDELISTLQRLMSIPGGRSGMNIRFRGLPGGDGRPLETDYTISMGGLKVDLPTVEAVAKRGGIATTHLPGRLMRAFKTFFDFGVTSFYLDVPPLEKNGVIEAEWRERLRISLFIISRYTVSLNTNQPIVVQSRNRKHLVPLVRDDVGEPDINLTLLAGVNGVRADLMADLVRKAAKWMDDAETLHGGLPYTTVYDALMDNRGLRDKLAKPPVEINNLCRLAAGDVPMVVTKEAAKVSRMVMREFKKTPQQAARVFQSVYGADYKSIGADRLGTRIQDANLLFGMLDSEARENVRQEVLANMKQRFDDIHESVFEDFIVAENGLKRRADGKIEDLGKLNPKLGGFIDYYKGRTAARRKLRNIRNGDVHFTARDYKALSIDFGISPVNATALVNLLKKCFGADGRFRRSVFERYISDFARFETKVFRFLWQYLKETADRRDRIAFINSLQRLIAEMDRPLDAVKMLLEDAWADPDAVHPTDQEAFMLCNLLLRTYNKELDVEIEVTPEEVLLVKDGLNRKLAKAAGEFVTHNFDRLLSKASAIGDAVIAAMAAPPDDVATEHLRTLLFVEREMLIFLSLVGGDGAKTFLKSAVRRYGATVLDGHLEAIGADRLLPQVIRHLVVIVRGIERLADVTDLTDLEQLSGRETRLHRMTSGENEKRLVRRLMDAVQSARQRIEFGVWHDLYKEA